MKESATAAVSLFAHARGTRLPDDYFAKHIAHSRAGGAVPKDGPMPRGDRNVDRLALDHIKVDDDLAMTGEVTLTGQVLPIAA